MKINRSKKESNNNSKNKSLIKNHKNTGIVIGTIIGAILTGSLGVAAVTLSAEQIKYTPKDSSILVTNAKQALDEIYKIAEYKIPVDTYFYDSNTNGKNVVRYKKVDGNYYLCNEKGIITNNTSVDVTSVNLIEYRSSISDNLSLGTAGYVNESLLLGDGMDNNSHYETGKQDAEIVYVEGSISSSKAGTSWSTVPLSLSSNEFATVSNGVLTALKPCTIFISFIGSGAPGSANGQWRGYYNSTQLFSSGIQGGYSLGYRFYKRIDMAVNDKIYFQGLSENSVGVPYSCYIVLVGEK